MRNPVRRKRATRTRPDKQLGWVRGWKGVREYAPWENGPVKTRQATSREQAVGFGKRRVGWKLR